MMDFTAVRLGWTEFYEGEIMRSIILCLCVLGCAVGAEELKLKKFSSSEVEYDFDNKIFKRGGKPFTGISVIKNSAGEPVKEISIVNGKQNGYEVSYNNGKVMAKVCYKDGLKDGVSYIYSLRDFTLCNVDTYKGGKKNGVCKSFEPDGKVKVEAFYKDGKRDGAYKMYDSKTGKVKIEGQYTAGKRTGKWTYYKADGSVSRQKEY